MDSNFRGVEYFSTFTPHIGYSFPIFPSAAMPVFYFPLINVEDQMPTKTEIKITANSELEPLENKEKASTMLSRLKFEEELPDKNNDRNQTPNSIAHEPIHGSYKNKKLGNTNRVSENLHRGSNSMQQTGETEATIEMFNELNLKSIDSLHTIIKLSLQKNFKFDQQMLQNCSEESSFMIKAILAFDERSKSFRKSKEEMLKIIIRRIQRHYRSAKNGKKDKKFLLYGGYKSMNIAYLNRLFSDPLFVESYKVVANEFNKQFEEENFQKVNDFVQKLKRIKSEGEVEQVIGSLDEKGRMPWPTFWMERISKVLMELYWRFIVKEIKF